jgi:hypothetical protein
MRTLLSLLTVAWLIGFTSSAAAQPQISTARQRSDSLIRNAAIKRLLTSIETSETADALRILISASTHITDAVSYRSADRFVIVIPQADVSALQLDIRGVNNFQMDKRDEDVALSFRLDAAANAELTVEDGRLVVVLRKNGQPAVPTREIADRSSSSVSRNLNDLAKSNPLLVVSPPPAPQTSVPANIIGDIQKLFKTTSVDVANLDLSTPESPAFTVLGLNPQTIVRPASPREFATSLINGLDKNGNFQSGLAIDTAPYLLFNGQHVTLEDYNKDRLTRFLTRTQFSFAAAKGESKDDPTTKLSLGLNLTLYDAGDPRVYRPGDKNGVLQCFEDKLQDNLPLVSPVPVATYDQRRKDAIENYMKTDGLKYKQLAEQCREDGRKAHWNKDSWTVAFAPSWISKTGNSSDFKWNGGALWTSYAHGVGTTGQLILHARFRNKEQVPDPAKSGSFIIQNSAFFGGRFRMGNPDFGLNVEGVFVHNSPENKPSKSTYEFSFGAEKKLAENVYFVVSAGSKGPQADNTKSHGFVITSFKYGFSKKPQLATP